MEADFPSIPAGKYPPELLEFCRRWSVAPGALLAWSVRRDGITVVLPSGQKVGATVTGDWTQAPAIAAAPQSPKKPASGTPKKMPAQAK